MVNNGQQGPTRTTQDRTRRVTELHRKKYKATQDHTISPRIIKKAPQMFSKDQQGYHRKIQDNQWERVAAFHDITGFHKSSYGEMDFLRTS